MKPVLAAAAAIALVGCAKSASPVAVHAGPPPTTDPPTTDTAPTTTTTTEAPTTTIKHWEVEHPTTTATVRVAAPVMPVPTSPPTTASSSDPYTTACYPSVGMAPRNSTEACISARENGGCYDRSGNLSHFGRWQLSQSLWAKYGGGNDWGRAGPKEQDRVFTAVVAAKGYSDWRPYDGC